MKVRFKPEGGRFGYGFDYFCAECGEYLGNSVSNKHLEHSATETKGFFRKKTIPVNCVNAGKVCAIPTHETEAVEITKEAAS